MFISEDEDWKALSGETIEERLARLTRMLNSASMCDLFVAIAIPDLAWLIERAKGVEK